VHAWDEEGETRRQGDKEKQRLAGESPCLPLSLSPCLTKRIRTECRRQGERMAYGLCLLLSFWPSDVKKREPPGVPPLPENYPIRNSASVQKKVAIGQGIS
jgi:hypothetical protein